LALKEKRKNQIILIVSILLISFGTVNLSLNIYGQESQSTQISDTEPKKWERVYQDVTEQLLTVALPYVGGALGIVIQWARSKGLQISKEAEEYIINASQSIVQNQSRILFNKVYENKELLAAWAIGTINDEGKKELKQELKKYQKEAKDKALSDLREEIKSSKFKKNAGTIVGDNLGTLIERTYTKNQADKAERAKKLLFELSSLAIDSALLYYDKKKITDQDKRDIIEKGIKAMAKNFDFESIILDVSNATMHLEADLSKKLES
jgi:virulence-associated protein VapD